MKINTVARTKLGLYSLGISSHIRPKCTQKILLYYFLLGMQIYEMKIFILLFVKTIKVGLQC